MSIPIAELPVRRAVARLADPQQHSGGGAAAAVSLAGAAGCAELVLSLAVRRKSNAPRRNEIRQLLERARALRERFLIAGDRDDQVLTTLLAAQKAARAADAQARAQAEQAQQDALRAAAQAPLDLATDGLGFLHLLRDALPFATRFTVPDLGGAATMAHGAIDAVLLMADVNLALLGDDPHAVPQRSAVAHIRQEAPSVANHVLHLTRAMIAGALPEEAPRG